jgi:hypothetical protein
MHGHLARHFRCPSRAGTLASWFVILACEGAASPEAYRLEIVDGEGQIGELGGSARRPLIVRVVDGREEPVAGNQVWCCGGDSHGQIGPLAAPVRIPLPQ